MKKLTVIAFLLLGTLGIFAKEYQAIPLKEFLNPALVTDGAFSFRRVSDSMSEFQPKTVDPEKDMEFSLTLKTPVSVPDDVKWFTMPVYYRWKYNIGVSRVSLVFENAKGKNFESRSFRRTSVSDRAWCNFVSEIPVTYYPPEMRTGLKVKAVKFIVAKGTCGIFFKAPVLFCGNLFSPELYATSSSAQPMDVWYDCPGKITPVARYSRNEKMFCTLTLRDGDQKEPFYSDSGMFDYTFANGFADPVKAEQSFTIPQLPKGIYLARLTVHDPKSKMLIKSYEFPYEVLSSPVKKYPVQLKKDPLAQLVRFVPDKPDFIFDKNSVSGKLTVSSIPADWNPQNEPLTASIQIQENQEYWYPHNTAKPAVYENKTFEIPVTGSFNSKIMLSVPEKLVKYNRAFQVKITLKRKNMILDEMTYLVGIKGKTDRYDAHSGKLLTWQEAQSKPMLSTGIHAGIRIPQCDMENFIRKIRQDGVFDYVKVDASWSPQTEPLKGFYTYDYIDDWLDLIAANGLKASMQTGGNMKFPRWAYFELEPDRVQDGRFLKNHYNCYSVYADCPGKYVRAHIMRLADRYAECAAVGYYEIWSYMGEGFNFDWWLNWQFGGGVGGYGESGVKCYHDFIREKYGTIDKLNKTYGTSWKNFDSVPVPQPDPHASRDLRRIPFPLPSNAAYRDFEDMKIAAWRDYMEVFLMDRFRSKNPERSLSLFYYGNNNSTPGIFKKHPGMMQRNGGGEGIGIPGKEVYYFSGSCEDTPTMSEDAMVYGDTVDSWRNNIFGNLRIGRLGLHFSNYSIYQTRGNQIELERNDSTIIPFFQDFKANVMPYLADTEPLPPACAVFYDYESRIMRKGYIPAKELAYGFYLPEPLNYAYLDRLPKYKVVFMDVSTSGIGTKSAKALADWVRQGGVLVMTAATGARNRELAYTVPPLSKETVNGAAMPEKEDNYLLKVLGIPLPQDGCFGNRIGGPWWSAKYSKEYFPDNGRLQFGREYTNYLFPDNAYPQAETLAVFTGMNGKLAGKRAILRFQVGKGSVILFSQYPAGSSKNCFYEKILQKNGVPKYLEISCKDNTKVPYASISAYPLKKQDGSLIVMAQFAGKNDPNFRMSDLKENEPFERMIHVMELPDGFFAVYSLFGGKKLTGVFSAAELRDKGFPASFSFNELKAFLIQKTSWFSGIFR